MHGSEAWKSVNVFKQKHWNWSISRDENTDDCPHINNQPHLNQKNYYTFSLWKYNISQKRSRCLAAAIFTWNTEINAWCVASFFFIFRFCVAEVAFMLIAHWVFATVVPMWLPLIPLKWKQATHKWVHFLTEHVALRYDNKTHTHLRCVAAGDTIHSNGNSNWCKKNVYETTTTISWNEQMKERIGKKRSKKDREDSQENGRHTE